jgi:hypothetical protein
MRGRFQIDCHPQSIRPLAPEYIVVSAPPLYYQNLRQGIRDPIDVCPKIASSDVETLKAKSVSLCL